MLLHKFSLKIIPKGKISPNYWKFENGSPASFHGKTPPNIIFAEQGKHTVTLTVSNGYQSETYTDFVTVKPPMVVDFSWEVNSEDYDYQVPVTITLKNQTQNAIAYQWQMQGAIPFSSTQENPVVTFPNTGVYTIVLEASNGKTTQTIEKQITIHPNTGIYTLENVKLGTNYAHNTQHIGAFYSTKLRKSFTSAEITPENAPLIDIVFQGVDATFATNRFISPTQVQNYGFKAIPNAQATFFVNSQEICSCNLNFSERDFNQTKNDLSLIKLVIPHTTKAQQSFDNQLPRIVLFQRQDGKIGAIKIKKFVSDGANNSYILCDIKVQK